MRQQNKSKQVTAQLSQIWSQVVENLTLRQLDRCMGGDMSYKSKAERAMQASRSETVHALCIEMIGLYESHFEIQDLNQDLGLGLTLSDFE